MLIGWEDRFANLPSGQLVKSEVIPMSRLTQCLEICRRLLVTTFQLHQQHVLMWKLYDKLASVVGAYKLILLIS